MRTRPAPFIHFIHWLETGFDLIKYRRHRGRTHLIQVFRGYGSQEKSCLMGRVLETKFKFPSTPGDSWWTNLLNTYRRFETDEAPFAVVRVHCDGGEWEIQADEEGYFVCWMTPNPPFPENQEILPAWLEMIDPAPSSGKSERFEGQIVIPPPGCRLGVISDIDDTIIRSEVTHPLSMVNILLFSNARTRRSYAGTASFYRGLRHGAGVDEMNPIFYASSSPWNIYDLLEEYLAFQKFPPNPIFYLRDWGITDNEILPLDNRGHKLNFIDLVLGLYPELPFILVGDSGQQDPEIYREVVEKFPGRILAIYIREVTQVASRIEAIHRLRAGLARKGIPVILADTVLPMAEHAARQGWIRPEIVDGIAREFRVPRKFRWGSA
jgi:phosphatidate phosphatase APP1